MNLPLPAAMAERGSQFRSASTLLVEDNLADVRLTVELLREANVLEHLRAGRSNAEIALALSVSVETIRTHRRNIYRKLGVRTRRELASLTWA